VRPLLALLLALSPFIAGCGTRVPIVQEVWEPVAINEDLKLKIRKKIFCETAIAIQSVRNKRTGVFYGADLALPEDYGVQIQTTITIDEATALNPSVGLQEILPNAVVSKVNVPQSRNMNLTGTLSSVATRVDTSYSYYNVGKISYDPRTGREVNTWCKDPDKTGDLSGSSPLLIVDLGIEDYLRRAVYATARLPSSAVVETSTAGKTAKLDVFSYQVKFVVVTSGGINPVIKLANLATGFGTQPLLSMGRTRTHDLILTFGPGDKNGPIQQAASQHNLQSVRSPLQ
jgi:hypothetical protein